VHHAQDVVAGLAIGMAAGALGIVIVNGTLAALERRGSRRPTGAETITEKPEAV
jgi:hypothetical protein